MDHTPLTTTADISAIAAPAHETSVLHTTRRAIATVSMCLGIWSVLVFWWYPFGLFIGTTAAALASLAIFFGWRSGENGFHLAWFGLFFGGSGAGMAFTSYRVMQYIFEGSLPHNLIPI